MRFKTFYRLVFLAAVIVDFMDYGITQVGFSRFSPWFEANPYVRILMGSGVNAYLASSIVFSVTIAFVLGAYYVLKGYLDEQPYSGGMREVGGYLWNLSTTNARDLAVFACLALVVVLIVQHLFGFLTWLTLFV